MSFLTKLINWPFILCIKLYQWVISPIFPATCRFEPTCSNYAIQSIKEWGVFKGLFLAAKRIYSCKPGSKFGYDPVPKRNPNQN